jgi:hypothetical protein
MCELLHIWMRRQASSIGCARLAPGECAVEEVMPRLDLLDQSAPRVELDQRSREARLRLEQIERLLVVLPLPTQSLLQRVLRCLGSGIDVDEESEGGTSTVKTAARGAARWSKQLGEAGGAAGAFSGASARWRPDCSPGARSGCDRTVYGWPLAPRCRETAPRRPRSADQAPA